MLITLLCTILASVSVAEVPDNSKQPTRRAFYIDYDNNQFMMDDKPFRYIAGSLHYFRVPLIYWRDRLEKLKAAGLNAVDTYVEWSLHNPKENVYMWKGNADLINFIEIAEQLGLYVILRPGPYICAERDFGGQPSWLLSKYFGKDMIKPRTTDYRYLQEVEKWIRELFSHLRNFLYGNNGPIIMVQIENEYGNFGCDDNYKKIMFDLFEEEINGNAVLFTTDGYWDDKPICGKMGNAYATVDFGPDDDVEEAWRVQRMVNKKGPLVNSEYYTGWLTHWGDKKAEVSHKKVADTLRKMLTQNASVSLYMFAGGTNFDFTNGANYENNTYSPQITSYDYDAPLNEAGDPTPKYMAIKQVISEFVKIPHNKSVTISPKGNYGKVKVKPGFSLFSPSSLISYKHFDIIPSSFEELHQQAGFIINEKILEKNTMGEFFAPHLRDRALVYLNEKYIGNLDRRLNKYSLKINAEKGSKLQLIVEHMGRINYGQISAEYKGLGGKITWGDEKVYDWNSTSIPLFVGPIERDFTWNVGSRINVGHLTNGPIIYGAKFNLPRGITGLVRDTFLDMTHWGKGIVWINGHNLGRYWSSIGPQMTLYVPKFYLFPEDNWISILELEYANPDLTVAFVPEHKFNNTAGTKSSVFILFICIIFNHSFM